MINSPPTQKYFPLVTAVVFLFLVGCSSDEQVKPLKPLHVATGNWQPFVGQNMDHYGPMAEMMTTILVDLHYVPEFKFYDWPIAESHLAAGYPSIGFPFIKSSAREESGFRFSEPLVEFDYVLFFYKKHQKQASQIKSLDELMKLKGRIGLIRGYAKLANTPDDAYTPVASTLAGFNMLRDGSDIDFLLESRVVGMRMLESQAIIDDKDDFMFLGQFSKPGSELRSKLINKVGLRIMLSPKLNPGILKHINSAIERSGKKTFFNNLRQEMKNPPTKSETAHLVSDNEYPVQGYRNAEGNEVLHELPQNNFAMVIKWGGAFGEVSSKSHGTQPLGRTKVKLLNGPYKGKVMWVSNSNIILQR